MKQVESPQTFAHGHALLVGVGADLPMTVKDARDLERALTREDLCAYPPSQVKLLTQVEADRDSILAELDDLALRANRDPMATVIVYFSGHGLGGSNPRLVPFGYDPDRPDATTIGGVEFADKLRAIHSQKLVVILDCCHAAGNADPSISRVAKAPIPVAAIEKLTQGEGRVVLASSRADEFSYLHQENSYFTEALLEALSGHGASRNDGYTRVLDTALYVGRVVPERRHGYQHPVLEVWNLSDNFALAYHSGGVNEPQRLKEIRPRPRHDLSGRVQSGLSLQLERLDKAEAHRDFLQKQAEDFPSEQVPTGLQRELERARRAVLELRGQLGQIPGQGPLGKTLAYVWTLLGVLSFYFSYNLWAMCQEWPAIFWSSPFFQELDQQDQEPILALYGLYAGTPLLGFLLYLTRRYQQLDEEEGFVSPLPIAFNLPLYSDFRVLRYYQLVVFVVFLLLPMYGQVYFMEKMLEGEVLQRVVEIDPSSGAIEVKVAKEPLEFFYKMPPEDAPPFWQEDEYRLDSKRKRTYRPGEGLEGGATFFPVVTAWVLLLLNLGLLTQFGKVVKALWTTRNRFQGNRWRPSDGPSFGS